MSDTTNSNVASPDTNITPSETPAFSTVSSPSAMTEVVEPEDQQQDGPATPKPVAPLEHDDDVPMMDISPGKGQKTDIAENPLSRLTDTGVVLDPGSSPPKAITPDNKNHGKVD